MSEQVVVKPEEGGAQAPGPGNRTRVKVLLPGGGIVEVSTIEEIREKARELGIKKFYLTDEQGNPIAPDKILNHGTVELVPYQEAGS